MKMQHPHVKQQAGSMLLEALFAFFIFSMGILALVGLQATSVKQSTAGKYRSDASLLANELIGQMWVSDHTPATLKTNFSSPDGAGYKAWLVDVKAALPGVAAAPPDVGIDASGKASITISWKAPNDAAADPVHSYTVTAQIPKQ